MKMSTEINANVLEPNVDLGILVGLLLTDGSLSKNKNSWQIEFTNKSQELHELFQSEMLKIFGNQNFKEMSDSQVKEIKRTILRNKLVAENLLKIVPTFRTKINEDGSFPESKIPEFVFNLPKVQISGILQAMFSADGCISLWVIWNKRKRVWEIKKLVKISSKHPVIREQVTKLLQNLEFQPTLREINDEVVLFKKRDIIKFRKEIGFVKGVKVTKDSKNWEGFGKNQILDLAIKTFELRKKDLENFKAKEEVIDFLKTLVPAHILV